MATTITGKRRPLGLIAALLALALCAGALFSAAALAANSPPKVTKQPASQTVAAVNCTSSASCTMTSPAHEAGTVDVIATVSKVKSPTGAGDLFTYS